MSAAPSSYAEIIAALSEALPEGGLLDGAEDTVRYSRDWPCDHFDRPFAAARPGATAQTSARMRRCWEISVPVVAQRGLTGHVGAAVAAPGGREFVISLERLNAIRSVDPIDFTMIIEAGCVLETAENAAYDQNCLLPITFGAQGSCQIGCNIATNAGGMNVLRYGMTRDQVLGLEVVLADGRIWNGFNVLRKDNRGYNLKQLFIGSEGTLGIVTAAALKLFPKPAQVETALISVRSIEDAMALYARARRICGDLITAFELILRNGLEMALHARTDLIDPLNRRYPVYVLMDAATSAKIELKGLIESLLPSAEDIVEDGVMASSRAQAERLWLFRETMVETQGRGGRYLRTDVSLPISKLAAFVGDSLDVLRDRYPEALALAYGHLGDGNVHFNVIPPVGASPDAMEALFREAEELIFDVVDRPNGSISAEHGIGRVKQKAFLNRTDGVSLDLAARLKSALDPTGLMSPDVSCPPETAWRFDP